MPQPGALLGAATAEDELDPDWRPEDYEFDRRNLTVQKSGEYQQCFRTTSSTSSQATLSQALDDHASEYAQKARRRQTGMHIIKVEHVHCMKHAWAGSLFALC